MSSTYIFSHWLVKGEERDRYVMWLGGALVIEQSLLAGALLYNNSVKFTNLYLCY